MANTTLTPLNRADGSATYSKSGYSVIAAVTGPSDVQRRDELPEEAVIDVAVRPAAGVGGTYKPGVLHMEHSLMRVQDYGKGTSNLLFKTPSTISYRSQHTHVL